MANSIVEFWRECRGPVHPADAQALSTVSGLFNLEFPPPAFMGDILNAPVIVLNGNGGYDPDITPKEFPDDAAVRRWLDRLHNPRKANLMEIAPYYRTANYAPWLESGELAMVNALAYRSPSITKEVRAFAPRLESVRRHFQWLHNELLPEAQEGRRLVIAHRYALWHLDRNRVQRGLHFTSSAVSKNLPRITLDLIISFIAGES